MAIPIQVSFRHMESSEALQQDLEARLQALASHDDHVLSAHASIEGPSGHHRKGGVFRAAIAVRVAHGQDFAAVREHEDAYGAVREAIAAAEQQLERRPGRRRDTLRRSA